MSYGGYGWLTALAAANTVASLFYYLRWLAPAFLPGPAGPRPAAPEPGGRAAAAVACTAGAASLALGIAGSGSSSRAMDAVGSPHTTRKVSVTRDAGSSAGWQHANSSAS